MMVTYKIRQFEFGEVVDAAKRWQITCAITKNCQIFSISIDKIVTYSTLKAEHAFQLLLQNF